MTIVAESPVITQETPKKKRKVIPVADRVQRPGSVRWAAKANLAIRLGRRFAKACEKLSRTKGYDASGNEWDKLGKAIDKVIKRVGTALSPEEAVETSDVF